MSSSFEIKSYNGDVIIKKDGESFRVYQGVDGDIWFYTGGEKAEISIERYSRNDDEFESYELFEGLMKNIIGRFMLEDYDDEYSFLPKDFIDLPNRTITWHSDSDHSKTLQLSYHDKVVTISLMDDKSNRYPLKVRVRTSGSDYGYYYQEFVSFFHRLSSFAFGANQAKDQMRLSLTNQPKE